MSQLAKRRRYDAARARLRYSKAFVPRGPKYFGPVPTYGSFKFKYSELLSLNAPIGIATYHTFRANSLFDPDFTSTGHQPYGFDQIMALYWHFTVVGAKITVETVNSDTTTVPTIVFCRTRAQADTITDMAAIMEAPRTDWALIAAGGAPTRRVSSTFGASNFFGKQFVVGGSDYRGSSSANPNELAFFQVGIAGANIGDDPQAQNVCVTIEFSAVMTEPRIQTQS
jgi:hypothetical protein